MPYKNKEDRNKWQRDRRVKKGRKMADHLKEKHRVLWTGKGNPRWKGGITNKDKAIRNGIEFRLWREAVFARDNWTCQDCGVRGGYLEAHHIKSFAEYKELRFAIDNGQTLCRKCHKKTDNFCGRTKRLKV